MKNVIDRVTSQKVYQLAQKCCGLNVGDFVQVLRKAGSYECGWGIYNVVDPSSDTGWVSVMDKCIHEVGQIVKINSASIEVLFPNILRTYELPFFILQKTDPPKTPPMVTFKPFEKVLVAGSLEDNWFCTFYSDCVELYPNTHRHRCVNGGLFKYCIPYKGNEDLVGKKVKKHHTK